MIGSGAEECVGTTDDVGNVMSGNPRRYAPIFVFFFIFHLGDVVSVYALDFLCFFLFFDFDPACWILRECPDQ